MAAKTIFERRGKCCASCEFYDVQMALDVTGKVMPDRVAWCMFEPVIPASFYAMSVKYAKKNMAPDGGKDCPCWQQRDEGGMK